MEGIHRAETWRGRLHAESSVCGAQLPCPCDISGQVVSTAPMSPTSPAPPSRSNAPMCRHGKLRPRHPRPHRGNAHHPFLVAAGKKARQHRKSAMSARPPQKRAPVESAFMAASTESLSLAWPAPSTPVGRAAPASRIPCHGSTATVPMEQFINFRGKENKKGQTRR